MTETPTRWNPPNVAQPMGAYTHLTSVPVGHQLVFIAGQVGIDPDGNVTSDDPYEQAIMTYANLERHLDALRVTPASIIRLLTFVAGSEHLPGWSAARDEVYARWFGDTLPPGHTLVVVQALARPNLKVETEGWVAVPQEVSAPVSAEAPAEVPPPAPPGVSPQLPPA